MIEPFQMAQILAFYCHTVRAGRQNPETSNSLERYRPSVWRTEPTVTRLNRDHHHPLNLFKTVANSRSPKGVPPYFFAVLLQTQLITRFRPLGHAGISTGSRRFSFGSPRVFHSVTQGVSWVTQPASAQKHE